MGQTTRAQKQINSSLFTRPRRTKMKISRRLLPFCLLSGAFAQQAPWGRADIPISNHDRVYAADQTSTTVSVIDPSSNKLLGLIRLGDPVSGAIRPLYTRHPLV